MNDDKFLKLCQHEAELARWACPPNPAVGCVLVDPAGVVIGTGHTQRVGHAHAEIMALRDASARGHSTAGATAWVSLEPCSHQGRTGPCCDALVAAGVVRVVASLQDPNPLVGGQGFARLRAAGVALEIGPGREHAFELNIGFFSRMVRRRPWVRMKIAASLDGRTALDNGVSQWITSPQARDDGQAWRARACAVLTGVGTVLQDDPTLNVRAHPTQRQPTLVVVDSHLQTPPQARLLQAGRPVLVCAAVPDHQRQQELERRGAEVVYLPGSAHRADKVDLNALLTELTRREFNEIHVEAGNKLNGSLLQAGLVDELLMYVAPKLLGPGQGIANLPALADLAMAQTLEFVDADRVGPDLRLRARFSGRDSFMPNQSEE